MIRNIFSRNRFFTNKFFSKNIKRFCSNNESDALKYDVLIVGGGPAGLSSAIRLKQLNEDLNVCVVEKGSEIGSHILSGNVFETKALDELIENWKELEALGADATNAIDDNFLYLSNENNSYKVPKFLQPPILNNNNNYIISLGRLTKWMAEYAENMGVEIYPGFAADKILYKDDKMIGIKTSEMGLNKDGSKKDTYMDGIEIHADYNILAEGARGSCSEKIIKKYNLRKDCDVQSYGLGIKEVWEIPEEKSNPGYIQHTFGWPLDNSTYGGSFLYHMKKNKILLGFVVGLDYKNPYISPYQEFQRFKHHPDVKKHIEGGECISYGARVINEGGFQSIPKLSFPGGCLIGCSAGFVNVPKIKGTHTAMKSGMLAAESIHEDLINKKKILDLDERLKNSWIYDELKEVRNYGASFKYGNYFGILYSGLSGWILRGKEPWTFSKNNNISDSDKTELAEKHNPIKYPQPDNKISFDLLTNLQKSGTYHEDQPSHLKIKKNLKNIPNTLSILKYDGPEQRFCPAKVYEYNLNQETGIKELNINSQNCIHCKCCSIKMPKEYIDWNVPEGGNGPSYNIM
jgi:electron-transferring-flavoprotein dehydrogenase